MFAIAILAGIYSYVIFGIGVLGLLYKSTVFITSLIFIACSYFYFKKNPRDFPRFSLNKFKGKPFLLLFFVMVLINLVGALGPELSFDALWYHLTIPKIFIEAHRIFFIQGGLFYYSVMPKLGEMLFIPGLMMGSEIIPKLIQWGFGILTSFAIFKLSRKFLDDKLSIVAVLIFYSSMVVAWQSTVAYIDLIRTFFEIMTLWGFVEFCESKNRKWLIESAVMLGLAISTKTIALGAIPIFITLLLIFDKNWKKALSNSLIFVTVSILVSFPWFFFSFLNTGNPFYPVFSGLYPVGLSWDLLNPINFSRDLFILFFKAADPISPIYIIFLPLIFIYFKKINKELKIISIYSLLALIIWYLTPRTGGGRFILPYLPAFSILVAVVIANTKIVWLRKYLTGLVIVVCLITIMYRGIANSKFVPVIFGVQTRGEFLTKNLNFSFGDFYDTDGWFEKNITNEDIVLLYGFHNLYYANFPFVHESYVKKGDKFNYIAAQKAELPDRFKYWNLIYYNSIIEVNVYSMKGEMWFY
ncbi:MAG: glycosyltransferase family 39 protein [Candidatus Levybacteria bacterium]|nr:glycosyltransferase family 39 protein [Candidatus Levybacteria bacterium]